MLHPRNLVALKADVAFLGCNGVASAFVGDISGADLLVTERGSNPSVLANLRAKRLKVVTADPGTG